MGGPEAVRGPLAMGLGLAVLLATSTVAGAQKPAPQAAPGTPPPGCAAPLRSGCEAQAGSCRLGCPPQWSTDPRAPAFTPNDRAACTQRCLNRYLGCLQLHGCM